MENKIKFYFIVFDCIEVPSACRAHSHQKRGLEPLELELQNLLSCPVGAELPAPHTIVLFEDEASLCLWLTRNCRPDAASSQRFICLHRKSAGVKGVGHRTLESFI